MRISKPAVAAFALLAAVTIAGLAVALTAQTRPAHARTASVGLWQV